MGHELSVISCCL
jgi:hypothetical protein